MLADFKTHIPLTLNIVQKIRFTFFKMFLVLKELNHLFFILLLFLVYRLLKL